MPTLKYPAAFPSHPRRPNGFRPAPLTGAVSAAGGFSITEVLVSIVILTLGVLGFASAVGVISLELEVGRRETEVALLATDQLERLKAQGYAQVQPGVRVEGPYRLAWEIQGRPPARVLLVATYPGRNGSPRADSLVTYLPR